MKKQHYFLCLFFLLCFAPAAAQIVNIPDAAFKTKLLQLGIDTNGDGEIQNLEAEMVTSLYISNANISDLTGVEAFIYLTILDCSLNQLNSLNISQLIYLESLDCYINPLNTLYFGNNLINLQSINCFHDSLISLDVSNLPSLTTLDCDHNLLTDLTVNNCSNLTSLVCHNNYLTNLNVDGLSNLVNLDCSRNIGLFSLNMTGCNGLKYLYYSYCNLPNLNLNLYPNLITLSCGNNQISNLNISNLSNLEYLFCTQNLLTNLDVSMLSSLKNLTCDSNQINTLLFPSSLTHLYCGSNQLSNLDISSLTNLTHFSCYANQISELTFNNSPNLIHIMCQNNLLDTLNISNLNYLSSLTCQNNQLTALLVGNWSPMSLLTCHHNQLTQLTLTNFFNLWHLNCSNNFLKNVDVSDTQGLHDLYCDSNQLETLFIKNGYKESNVSFQNNPDLGYICADANQFTEIQQLLAQYGMPNVTINPFCSFSPVVGYNTVLGQSKYDIEENNCTANSLNFSHLSVQVFNSNTSTFEYFSTNNNGYYQALIDSGLHIFMPMLENPNYYAVNNASVNFPDNNFNAQMQDFCITPNDTFPDVEIILSPLSTAAIPGFNANYHLLIHNKGTNIANGEITLDFIGNRMNFLSSNTPTSYEDSTKIKWPYTNLAPFSCKSIFFEMNILPPPINNITNIISFVSTIELQNDIHPTDNLFSLNQILVGSYDPNDKTCLEGALLDNTKIGEYLHYLIRFQNTGTYYAQNVVVVDSIDLQKYDIASLQILETSHNGQIKVENGVLQFYFENIMLPDSFINEPASHGYALFKIKTKNSLAPNSTIKNKAEIYFDYNLPIITNVATTTFADNINLANEMQILDFQVYPNPAEDFLNIKTEKNTDFVVLNLLGTVLREANVSQIGKIDILDLPNGIYLLQNKNTGAARTFVKK